MATLHGAPYPGDWGLGSGKDDALFAAIPADRIIKFPFADGHAFYYVQSEKPLVLQHIPYGDAWHIDAATIRGLRLTDVQRMVRAEKTLRAMFDRKKAGV